MDKKLLLTFILLIFVFSLAMIFFDDDNSSFVSYLNNGGTISESQTPQSSNEVDNPVWTQGVNIPAPSRYHGSGTIFTKNDTARLYCLGGDENGAGHVSITNSIYNVNSNVWSNGAPMPDSSSFYCMSVTLGDTIYFMGGFGEGGAFENEKDFVKRYHVPTNTWSAGRNLPNTIAEAECEPYQDSLIYIIGGMTNGTSNATANVWLYNRISGYRTATPLPEPKWGHASAIINDTIIVVCGASTYSGIPTNSVYRGAINQSNRSNITWTVGVNYPGFSRIRFDGNIWGCNGMIMGPGASSGWEYTTDCSVYRNGNFISQPSYPTQGTSAAFYGSFMNSLGIWKWVVACGTRHQNPYSTPEVYILTDTLCRPFILCQYQRSQSKDNGFNKPIPDLSTIRDTINITTIPSWCTICDINVRMDTVLHTWDSDLAFTLTHGATTVALITNRGSGGDNFFGTVLDDSAANPISSGTAPFTGSFRPESPLSAYNSLSPNGLWVLTIVDGVGGDSGYLKKWTMIISYNCVDGGIKTIEVPFEYKLNQNYPNPFNPTTIIKFGLPKPGNTKLIVYDLLGREIIRLVDEYKNSGMYEATFDGTNLASGVYFYSLESRSYKETKKMLLLK